MAKILDLNLEKNLKVSDHIVDRIRSIFNFNNGFYFASF